MLDLNDETKRRLARVTLLVLLVLLLGIMNVVSVAQRDLLDKEQTTASFEETDFYERLSVGLQQELARNISKATTAEMNATQMADSAITEEYTRSVVNSNIDEVYLFLYAERETADISWDLTGAEQRLARQVADPNVRNEINATVPDVVLVQEDIAAGPLGTVQTFISLFPAIVGGCTTGTLLVLGLEGYRTRSTRRFSRRVGSAVSLVGLVSIVLGVLGIAALQLITLSFRGNVAVDPAIVSDGLARVMTNAAFTLVQQSIFLLAIGLVLVLIARTDTDRPSFGLSNPESTDTDES